MNSNNRLLVLQRILEQQSDSAHILSSTKLLHELKKFGHTTTRKTLYRDIDKLIAGDVSIKKTSRGFYIDKRMFQLAELRILHDSVLASKSITQKKANTLQDKIKQFCSEYEAKSHFSVLSHPAYKRKNEQIYNSIEIIQESICKNTQIRFEYHQINYYRSTTDQYQLSPYEMLWKNGYYYLIGNVGAHHTLSHFRLDNIFNIQKTRKKNRSITTLEDFYILQNINDYFGYHVNAGQGDKITTILVRCADHLYDTVSDTFGNNMIIFPEDTQAYFILQVKTSINKELVGWLSQFGRDIEVLSPYPLRKSMYRHLVNTAYLYFSSTNQPQNQQIN